MDLPDEVLSLIFFNLTVKNILTEVVNVCVRWREIIDVDAIFWKKLKVVVDCDTFINLSVINPSSSAAQAILKLKEQDEIYIGEHDLKRFSKLQCIKFENGKLLNSQVLGFRFGNVCYNPPTYSCESSLTKKIIDVISKSCKNLEKVEFSRCIGVAYKDTLKFLNKKNEKINEIRFDVSCIWKIPYEELTTYSNLNTIISHDYKFNRSDFYCLIDGCIQLSSLWIVFARYIKNDDVIYLLEKKKDSLKELGMGLTISDEVLSKVKECSCLTVLFFSDARYISDNGIKSLTNVSRLKYLSLHRVNLQPTVLVSWTLSSTIVPQLIVLDLTGYKFKDSKLLRQIPQVIMK